MPLSRAPFLPSSYWISGPSMTSIVTGDYVIVIRGEDDVADGQVRRVLGPDETKVEHRYTPGEWMPVLCWTGYVMWTPPENLIALTVDDQEMRRLFDGGYTRTGTIQLQF